MADNLSGFFELHLFMLASISTNLEKSTISCSWNLLAKKTLAKWSSFLSSSSILWWQKPNVGPDSQKAMWEASNFLSITSPCPFHPFTRQHVLCNWEDVAPTGGKWKKKGLWLIFAHRDEMDVQNLEKFFINFFLSTHFKNHGKSFSEPLYPIW